MSNTQQNIPRLQCDTFTLHIIACLVKKLGNDVTISQADFDAVAYTRLLENDQPESDSFRLTLVKRQEN